MKIHVWYFPITNEIELFHEGANGFISSVSHLPYVQAVYLGEL